MWELPSVGDIVWCRFPQKPRDEPGPKPRPALVVAINEYEDGVGVEVAYGTTQKVDQLKAGEFLISKALHKASYAQSGLSFDTKFDLNQILELPWGADFFDVPPKPQHGQHPKLGSLHIEMARALNAAAKAIKLI